MKETRVYKYGCRAPIEQGELVAKSMWLGHKYQNELTAIELARRAVYRKERSKLPAMEPLEAKVKQLVEELVSLRNQIKKARALTRKQLSDKEPTEAAKVRIAKARETIKQLKPLIRPCIDLLVAAKADVKTLNARVKTDPGFVAAVAILDEVAHTKMLQARKTCGVYWGTYLLAEASMQAAKKVVGTDPSFHRWKGGGRIGVQIQGGMTVEECYVCKDTRFRIEPVPFTAHEGVWAEPRWQRRFIQAKPRVCRKTKTVKPVLISKRTGLPVVHQQGVMTRVWIRVGSEGRDPIWAILPLYLHRPLPPDGVIKEVTIHRRRIGTHARLSCHITVVRDNVEPKPQRPGVIAINLGWRNQLEGNLRVGYSVDEAGNRGQLSLLAEIRARLKHAEGLQRRQALMFDEIKGRLGLWLVEQPKWPEWMAPLKTLDKWRSQGRLVGIVKTWRDNRLPGDAAIFLELEAWRKQARHLYQWESWERTRALDYRKHCYRNIAANLAREYGTLILHQFNIAKIKEKNETEDKEQDAPKKVQKQLQQGAPGELRLALKHAFAARGGVVLELPSKNITQQCHVCSELCDFDAAKSIMHTCEHCGATWDQDDNACMNLLSRDRSGGTESTEGAREDPEDDALPELESNQAAAFL